MKGRNYRVIFTAHSVPEIAKELEDPYLVQVQETVDEVVKRTGRKDLKYETVWQSESNNGMQWMKPDVLEYLREKAIQGCAYIFVPIGFISDHVETYYDIDVECKELCQALHVEFHRIEMPNEKDRMITALVHVIRQNANKEYVLYQPETEDKIGDGGKGFQSELKMPYFVKKLIEKKGKENVKMPESIRKMLIRAGRLKK